MLKRTTGKLIDMFKWLREHRPFKRKPEKPEPTTLNTVEDLFSHYGVDDPYEFGRMIYKYTSCGPWTAFQVKESFNHPAYPGERAIRREFSYDDYRHHEEFFKHLVKDIVGVVFGSIVEGSDQYAEPVRVEFPCTDDDIDLALQDVDDQCNDIWNETHGCPHCYHDGDDEAFEAAAEHPVNPNCKECGGHGIVI